MRWSKMRGKKRKEREWEELRLRSRRGWYQGRIAKGLLRRGELRVRVKKERDQPKFVRKPRWNRGEWKYILRPVLTASRPSQTMAQMGPLSISGKSSKLAFLLEGDSSGIFLVLPSDQSGGDSKRTKGDTRRTSHQSLEKWLFREILVVLLQVFFRRRDELDGSKLISDTGNGGSWFCSLWRRLCGWRGGGGLTRAFRSGR